MKASKPLVREQTDDHPASTDPRGSGETGRALRDAAQARKSHSRANRETLDKIGNVLEGYYARALREEVPERFKRLLDNHNATTNSEVGAKD